MKAIGQKIYYHDRAGSTNDLLKHYALGGEAEGTVVVAKEQTRGRGRRGRYWHSQRDMGLYFSFLLKPKIDPRQLGWISLYAAIAVAKAINKMTGMSATLKWPNDILLVEKKVGGILVEAHTTASKVRDVIVGIGINVLHPPGAFPPKLRSVSGSLLSCTEKVISKQDLLQAILFELNVLYCDSKDGDWPQTILKKWMALCGHLGSQVSIENGESFYSGRFVGLNELGHAIIQMENGDRHIVQAGDVSLRKEALCY